MPYESLQEKLSMESFTLDKLLNTGKGNFKN